MFLEMNHIKIVQHLFIVFLPEETVSSTLKENIFLFLHYKFEIPLIISAPHNSESAVIVVVSSLVDQK